MGVLEVIADGRAVPLRSHHLVGRASECALRLSHRAVSGVHAALRWGPRGWDVRDLGSRNGTWVNGRRLHPGQPVLLAEGAIITLGSEDCALRLRSAAAPVAVASGPRTDRVAHGDCLSLPDDDHPRVSVFRDADDAWVIESEGTLRPARDGEALEVDGARWTLHLPEDLPGTWDGQGAPPTLETVRFHFRVSLDEEHVELDIWHRRRRISLGARSHNYLLLTLARRRAEEESDAQVPASARGWLMQDELVRMLGVDQNHANVQIHRARRALADAGVHGGAGVVERRSGTGQLRFGSAHIQVERA